MTRNQSFSFIILIYIKQLFILIGALIWASNVCGQQAIRPNWRNYPIYSEARKSMLKNDYKVTIELLKKAVTEGKDNPDHLVWVYSELAEALLLYGEPESSFNYLEKMVELGFGKTYYQYSYFSRSQNFKYLWQFPKWNELVNKTKTNFINQTKADGDNPEVQLLFQEDQAERLFPKEKISQELSPAAQLPLQIRILNEQAKTQWLRQKEMKKIIHQKKVNTINDYRSAIFIFQHSSDIEGIKFAQKLAFQGYDLAKSANDKCNLGALIAVTTDRLLWYQGKPQIYGTQSRPAGITFQESTELDRKINELIKKFIHQGQTIPEPLAQEVFKNIKMPANFDLTLDPIDKTKITDEQRKMYCTKPLEVLSKGTVNGK